MTHVNDGQCGLCAHFGEHDHSNHEHGGHEQQLMQIRQTHEAPADLMEECGHPQHAGLHLVVTPISGCQGFEPAVS